MNIRIGFCAGLFAISLFTGCDHKETSAGSPTDHTIKSEWTCEEHWMVDATVKDLQGMAKLCSASIDEAKVIPAKDAHVYSVGGVTLALSPSCWDTSSYMPLLAGVKASPDATEESGSKLLHDLLTPTVKNLQQANKSVSAWIKESPTSAEAHQEAAFLLGVFGLRENASQFGDLRPLICRMTAHLAMADQLRGESAPTETGQWAKVLHDYHAGRPIKARAAMESIPIEGDSGRWKRVLDLLITGDWRRTTDLDEPSLAEAIAHARALQNHRGNAEMMEFVTQRKDLQAIPEWSRLLSILGHSVEDGHLVMRSGIPMEFLEIRGIFPIGKNPDPAKLAEFLAQDRPSALLSADGDPEVISNSDWAAYFRRHFYECSCSVSRFTHRQWDSPEAADEWDNSIMPYCKLLPDRELIESLVASRVKEFQKSLVKTADYIRLHPERAPMGLWFDYRFPNIKAEAGTDMPSQPAWFREVSPPGTAYHPTRRIRFSGITGADWIGNMRALHQIDPWNKSLCYEIAENSDNNIDSVKEAWGDVREYSVRPLRQILEGPSLTLDQRIETLRTLAAIDPEANLDLGAALVMAGQPDEAIKAYEIGFEKSPDRVGVSNQTRWMIHYYKSHGMDAKADDVANHNAEVYSATGLESAIALALEEKDTERATQLAAALSERYDDRSIVPIVAWLAKGDKNALKQVFPDGIHEVTREELETANARRGCRLEENSAIARSAGLRRGDIVLAIGGKRVETTYQYFMLMNSTLDPATTIIFRRGKKVLELTCRLPDRRLQVNIREVGR